MQVKDIDKSEFHFMKRYLQYKEAILAYAILLKTEGKVWF